MMLHQVPELLKRSGLLGVIKILGDGDLVIVWVIIVVERVWNNGAPNCLLEVNGALLELG